MSEHIVHTSILKDSFLLIKNSQEISSKFKEIANDYEDFALLGSITRGGDNFTVDLLNAFQKRWQDGADDELLPAKLAFVLGWLSHRAADRQMKPIWRGSDFPTDQSPTECSIYMEAFMFREYYSDDLKLNRAILSEELENNCLLDNPEQVEKVVNLFRAIIKRVLIEMHTFIPPYQGDIEEFLERLFSAQQEFKEDVIERMASAIVNPDPEKTKKYITDINFFDHQDGIIEVAQKLRQGEDVANSEFENKINEKPKSHYGKALAMSYSYILKADQFFKKRINLEELKEGLDINKPGRHGGYV
ncbi:MAG: hypothetical protein ACOC4G_10740 [Bacillota bacterium]